MAQENIKVTLPVSGKECEILSYVPHKVAKKVNRLVLGDAEISMDKARQTDKSEADLIDDMAKEMKLKMSDMTELADTKVLGLLVKYDGKTKMEIGQEILDELPEEDFNALSKEVEKVFEKQERASSPKA